MRFLLGCVILLVTCLGAGAQAPTQTFTNPLLPSGADPFSFYRNGFYYYMHTSGNRLELRKTANIANLATAEKKVIFDPPPNTNYSKQLWAPEIQYFQNAWYVYFAADDGDNKNHRMFVLENRADDPMTGEWTFKGQLSDPSNKWAIDGHVFDYNNRLYFVWAGWEADTNGRQNIYIATMSNPYTVSSDRIMISTPQLPWEMHGDLNNKVDPPHVAVNEGPQSLQKGNRLFIVYSASGCWTDNYALGLLELKGKDPMNARSWKKHPQPVFESDPENGVYATGHNSFFVSPNGKEDWILYHANSKPGLGCGKFRSPRAQKFSWNKDGTPNFGRPIKEGVSISLPASQ